MPQGSNGPPLSRAEAQERSKRVKELLEKRATTLVEADEPPASPDLPPEVDRMVAELLAEHDAARDLAPLLLAFSLVEGRPLNLVDRDAGDLTDNNRLQGDRTCSEHFGRVLRGLGIPATQGALEVSTFRGGYLSAQAARGVIHDFVRWASSDERTLEDLQKTFDALMIGITGTAARVPSLPDINHRVLLFPVMVELVDRLLAIPSGGAHEQYLFAALLHAVLDEGRAPRRVETKRLTASDASAGTAGDVEVREGQNLVEAYEVSASGWQEKLEQAAAILDARDELDRVNIIARAPEPRGPEIVEALAAATLAPGIDPRSLDISVLDVRSECVSLVARASRHARRAAVEKLYEYLRLRQPRSDLVENLVDTLTDLGVTSTE